MSDAEWDGTQWVTKPEVLLRARLFELADWWENEYVTDDGWPLICANQLRAELRRKIP